MKFFSKNDTLEIMKMKIEKVIETPENYIHIIGDLDFSKEDYEYMKNKIYPILLQNKNEIFYLLEENNIFMITYWVMALKFEDVEKEKITTIMSSISNLPQHYIKHFVISCFEGFEEMSLPTFGKPKTLDGLLSVVALHVGMLEEGYDILFDRIMDSQGRANFEPDIEIIEYEISERITNIFSYIDDDMKDNFFRTSRKVYRDYFKNKLTLEQILEKYHNFPSKLIFECVKR